MNYKLFKAVIPVLLMPTLPAQAGFLTGFAVGTAYSNNVKQLSYPDTAAVWSDKHDVISCKQADTPGRCHVPSMARRVPDPGVRGWRLEYPTESEYASKLGYTTIHRRGIVIQQSEVFVVMEVSKSAH